MVFGVFRNRSSRSGLGTDGRLASPLPAGAGRIGCEVIDPVGQPMGGAEVKVTSVSNPRMSVRGEVDPYGLFTAALPAGEYSVMVTAEGLSPVQQTVQVTAGRGTPPLRVALEPARQLELPRPGTWLFDPPHTAIRFIAKHVGMAHVHGRFTRFEGDIQIAENMAESHVFVRIDASSIATGNKTRDSHLRSADFLDVENYPYIEFESTRFVHRHGSKWTLQGTLTMHGMSRSVALETTYLGSVNGGYERELRCAALAKAELHREDFTLNWRSMLARGIAVVGPTVQLELDIQAMYHTHDIPRPPE
ncbi:YceI family protein [Streptomyces sp. NPDC046985]|uniref:YceI family protein n=1 Tax=Streptomyces sp. NPDC046985 TaxID=3155377 RepID=UPI0033F78774